jgi:hypothetical protein
MRLNDRFNPDGEKQVNCTIALETFSMKFRLHDNESPSESLEL